MIFLPFTKGVFVQQCAIAGCRNICGTSTKCVRTLYEIDELFASLEDCDIINLKVCNVHYNRDHRRHQQWSGESLSLAVQTCLSCNKSVKTTKSIPCKQHSISVISNNGISFNSAMSCCFFSEHCTQSSKITENENLYTVVEITNLRNYVTVSMHELQTTFCGIGQIKKNMWRARWEDKKAVHGQIFRNWKQHKVSNYA